MEINDLNFIYNEEPDLTDEVDKISDAVKISMQRVIDDIVPKQLHEEDFRFVKIRKRGQERYEKIKDEWIETGEYNGKEPYSGEKYKVFKDVPILELESMDILKDFINPYMPKIEKEKESNSIYINCKGSSDVSNKYRVYNAQLFNDANFCMADALTICGVSFKNPKAGHCEDPRHSSEHGKPMHYTEYGWTCCHCRDSGGFMYSGNAVEFVSAIKNVSMDEAYDMCAQYKGIVLDEPYKSQPEKGFDDNWRDLEKDIDSVHP